MSIASYFIHADKGADYANNDVTGSDNAEAFLMHTKQYCVANGCQGVLMGVGLGNELTNGDCPSFPNCDPLVFPETYAEDVFVLRKLLDSIWPASNTTNGSASSNSRSGRSDGDGAPPPPLLTVPDAG